VTAQLAVHGADSLDVHAAPIAADGSYRIDDLPPGAYNLVVSLPGTSLQFTGIPVAAGRTTGFDVPVDSAAVEVPPQPYAKVETDTILVFTPTGLDPAIGRLEGVVTDIVTRERASGVVVVATSPSAPDVITTVTDDGGHFAVASVPPGTYELSAFYQVARRGQIEVRRSGVEIAGGTSVYVPIYVELSGQE
jgi:hypothetical protein